MPETYAFVDGSFNLSTSIYGCGGFLVHDGKEYIIQDKGDDPKMVTMKNIAGELLGARQAILLAISLGAESLTIYYDYSGIEKWATGEWATNKTGTKAYSEFIQEIKDKIQLSFIHVAGHAGIEGNEKADRLAKEAVGIKSIQSRKKKK